MACLNRNDITFLLGPAGVSKTYVATAFAIQQLIHREVGIKVSRPSVVSGREIGFLPGSSEQKTAPFLEPVFDAIEKMCGTLGSLEVKANLKIVPLALIRGRNLDNTNFILDEAQNCERDELLSLLTRIGEGGRIIICGDVSQSDIGRGSPLEEIAYKLDGASVDGHSIGVHKFTSEACVRHPLIPEIIKRLE